MVYLEREKNITSSKKKRKKKGVAQPFTILINGFRSKRAV